jgi:hypothetical protein
MDKYYLAYMLRLWKVGQGEDAIWRVSLENAHTGECRAFASREALYDFLGALTAGEPGGESIPDDIATSRGAGSA